MRSQAIASEIEAAQRESCQVAPFTSRYPGFDVAGAYEVARQVHEAKLARGERAVGRKIGFTNANIWDTYGVHAPIWGFVYQSTLSRLSPSGATFRLAGLMEPKIEPEVAICFRDSPADGAPEEILAAVEWIAPAFEIVQTHFPGWKFRAPDTIADNGLHGALLPGEPVPVAKLGPGAIAALGSFALDLARDGRTVASGTGGNVLGNPLAAIAHLCSVLEGQPQFPPVRAGDIVTTGTITTAESIGPGETWTTTVRGIGLAGLRVSFSR